MNNYIHLLIFMRKDLIALISYSITNIATTLCNPPLKKYLSYRELYRYRRTNKKEASIIRSCKLRS